MGEVCLIKIRKITPNRPFGPFPDVFGILITKQPLKIAQMLLLFLGLFFVIPFGDNIFKFPIFGLLNIHPISQLCHPT